MFGRFSSHLTEQWIDHLSEQEIFLTLFTSDPYSVSDPKTVEVQSESMIRQPSAWTKTGPRTLELANEVFFHAIPQETTLVAIGAFDAEVNGNILFRDLLSSVDGKPTPIYMSTGGSFAVPEGQFIIGIDVETES